MVGVRSTVGVLTRTAADMECFMAALLGDERALRAVAEEADARFVPMPWREERAMRGRKLTIGW